MRVALFHNQDAGDGTSVSEILRLLSRHGHQLVHVVDDETRAEQILERSPDLVVAAGGDGTVAAAARVLARRGVPLAILPLGTANNIARSLCSGAPFEEVIAGWDRAQRLPLDIGIARGPWGELRFLESVGGGLIPAGIDAAKAEQAERAQSGTSKPTDAARLFRQALAGMTASRCTITIDGVSTTGDFLFIEVLNTPSIGPNLVLSKESNPSDGLFSVVIATEHHRDLIDRYLDHRARGGQCGLSLTPRHGRHIEIEGWTDVHVDDVLHHVPCTERVSITIQPAALEFLAGPCLAPVQHA